MTGTIRINSNSISVPTYIVKATEENGTQENRDRNFETKVFLDQVRAATKKINFEDLSGVQIVEKMSERQFTEMLAFIASKSNISAEEFNEIDKIAKKYAYKHNS